MTRRLVLFQMPEARSGRERQKEGVEDDTCGRLRTNLRSNNLVAPAPYHQAKPIQALKWRVLGSARNSVGNEPRRDAIRTFDSGSTMSGEGEGE